MDFSVDSLIDLQVNKKIKEMIEDLKEYIELKLIFLSLVNDRYSFYITELKNFSSVELLIRLKGPQYNVTIASIYIDIDFFKDRYICEFTNYAVMFEIKNFDNVEKLKEYIDKKIKSYEECFGE